MATPRKISTMRSRRRQGAGVTIKSDKVIDDSESPRPAPPRIIPQRPPTRARNRHAHVLVDNEPGVLARVIGLFSGRGYNIDSLTVSETEHQKHQSRITIVTSGTPMVIDQITASARAAGAGPQGHDLTETGTRVERELALVKVRGKGDNRVEALRLADAFRARVIDTIDRELRVRDHRHDRQDRPVRDADAAARPGRGVAAPASSRSPRPRGDVGVFAQPHLSGPLRGPRNRGQSNR